MRLPSDVALVACAVLLSGCGKNDQSPEVAGDHLPPDLLRVMRQEATKNPTREHIIGCGQGYGPIKQSVGVRVFVNDDGLLGLDIAAATNLTVNEFGRDIAPKDFEALQRAIARAVDERIGRPVVERVEITELRYERYDRLASGNDSVDPSVAPMPDGPG